MKIEKIEFLCSAKSSTDYPREYFPEIAFIGRSNVGKSSLINKLLERKEIAKISSTPGKTRALNFFRINGKFHFVDFPGYGYAKVSKKERMAWKVLIEEYLTQRDVLRLVILLRDVSIPDSPYDEQMKEWLIHFAIPFVEVYTKVDKLKSSERSKRLKNMRIDDESVILVSSKTGEGMMTLKKRLLTALSDENTP
jgi:GTP-binding protein